MTQKEVTPNKKRAAGVDWGEVHRRVETAQAALERKAAPTFAERKKVLRARAKALTREPERKEAAEEYVEVIEFLLAHEKYGLESRFVREVYPLKELTPLPGTPPFVLGLVNVRGQILSVIDLKKFFDLPEKGLTDLNKLIILDSGDLALSASTLRQGFDKLNPSAQGGASLSVNSAEGPVLSAAEGMAFGVLADAVLGVRPIPVRELQPSLPTLTGIREEFLKGVTRERVVILDAEKLLSNEDIIVRQEVEV